MEQIYH